ncbi:MAG TPA: hypothetical protein VF476_01920 [Chitinophagaceae bacterium]
MRLVENRKTTESGGKMYPGINPDNAATAARGGFAQYYPPHNKAIAMDTDYKNDVNYSGTLIPAGGTVVPTSERLTLSVERIWKEKGIYMIKSKSKTF